MRSILALAVLVPSLVQGQSTTTTSVSETIGYQGRLLRSNGTPETGTKEITFTIYGKATEDAPMTQLWSETQTVTLSNGFYAVFLGAKVPFSSAKPGPLFDGRDRWLGVKVGADGELTHRHGIASVATAITALQVKSEPWRAATLNPGWANGDAVVGFYKDGAGTVHLKGELIMAKACEPGAEAFTLPEGYRPREIRWFPAYVWTGSTDVFVAVGVKPTGELRVGSNFSGSNCKVLINGISFRAEQ